MQVLRVIKSVQNIRHARERHPTPLLSLKHIQPSKNCSLKAGVEKASCSWAEGTDPIYSARGGSDVGKELGACESPGIWCGFPVEQPRG